MFAELAKAAMTYRLLCCFYANQLLGSLGKAASDPHLEVHLAAPPLSYRFPYHERQY